jgi:hypothetical protein
MALFGQMSLSKDAIYTGEPVSVTLAFVDVKDIPEHKLSVNGADILVSDPMAGFFVENAVHVNRDGKQVLSYSLPMLLDEKGGLLFKKPGEYSVVLVVSDKSVEKKIIVKDIPAEEKEAFGDYEKLAEILPIFLLGEWESEAFSKADEMLKNHPKSRYSKLPALYYVSMSDRRAMQQIIASDKLEVGDKVDVEAFNKKRIAIHEANAKILSSFDFSNDGIVKDKAELVLLQNRLAKISAVGKVPPQNEILDLSKRLVEIAKKSTLKSYVEEAEAMKSMVVEMSGSGTADGD